MSNGKHQLVKEIDKVLEIEEKGLEIQCYNNKKSSRISNTDIYRIYLAICEDKGIKPRITYTGNHCNQGWRPRESKVLISQ